MATTIFDAARQIQLRCAKAYHHSKQEISNIEFNGAAGTPECKTIFFKVQHPGGRPDSADPIYSPADPTAPWVAARPTTVVVQKLDATRPLFESQYALLDKDGSGLFLRPLMVSTADARPKDVLRRVSHAAQSANPSKLLQI